MKEGWTEKIWDEVLEIRSGRNQKEVENPKGKFPIIGSAGKIMGYASDYICEEGTTLVGRKGTINNPMLIEEKFWNVDTAFGLHAKDILDKRFLHYFCLSFDFTEMDRGSGRPSLVKSDLLKIKMLVPPLPEQQRIVSILDQAFAAIAKAKANAEQNLKNAKELFESYLQGVFDPSTRSGQGKGDGWEDRKLGEICNVIGGGTPSKANSKFYDGDIYWATVRDMKGEVISDTEHKITEEAVINSSTNIIPKGNVIIATRVGLGKVCLIANDTAINQDLRGVVPINSKKLAVDFLYHWFKSIAHKIVEEGTGATVQGVKLPFIKSLSIPLPPLKEQHTIVRQLDALRAETQKLEAVYQKKIEDLEELKKSILQKAFAGELHSDSDIEHSRNAETKTEKSRRDVKIIENKINQTKPNPEGVI